MLVMLGMGLTLKLQDFQQILKMPRAVSVGVAAQYMIMPGLGWAIAKGLQLPTHFAVGLILVACCPGGTASNVVTFIARGDVALSVVMTLCSTILAIVLTPVLTMGLAGEYVAVDGTQLFWSTVQVVFIPLVLGISLNQWFPHAVGRILPVAPIISVLGICLICAGIFASNAAAIFTYGVLLVLAVFLLHGLGFLLGYYAARLAGYSAITARTISIEVGMQNSGLGIALARQAFSNPLTAVPAAISSLMHSLIGSLLAGIWRWQVKTYSS